MGAAARRAERDAVRRQKELARQRQRYEKMALLEQAEWDAQEYASHVDVLRSLHRDCGPGWDWRGIAGAPPPVEPARQDTNVARATLALEAFRPTILDRILGRTERKQAELRASIDHARELDAREYASALRDHEERLAQWAESRELANAILTGDPEAWLAGLEQSGMFEEIDALGSRIVFGVHEHGPPEAEIHVNTDDVIPREERTLLQSGRLSVKKMPAGKFNELYQDYVCGCVLRIAREVFALLPLEGVIVTAVADVLDTSTGHVGEQPILSVAFPRAGLERLNFDALDPSDAVKGFLHRMSFKKTTGFAPVERIDPESVKALATPMYRASPSAEQLPCQASPAH
jgi:hypothetical protein